jgi:hypothetical protein
MTGRSVNPWLCTAVGLLLWGRPMIPRPFDLFVGDEELLSNLFVGSLEKQGYTDLNTLVS